MVQIKRQCGNRKLVEKIARSALRLCRRTVRYGSAVPARVSWMLEAAPPVRLPRQRLGEKLARTRKAKPFRTVRRQSRKPLPTFSWGRSSVKFLTGFQRFAYSSELVSI